MLRNLGLCAVLTLCKRRIKPLSDHATPSSCHFAKSAKPARSRLETSKVCSGASPSRRCVILSAIQYQIPLCGFTCSTRDAQGHRCHSPACADLSASGCEWVASGVNVVLWGVLRHLGHCDTRGYVAQGQSIAQNICRNKGACSLPPFCPHVRGSVTARTYLPTYLHPPTCQSCAFQSWNVHRQAVQDGGLRGRGRDQSCTGCVKEQGV